MRALIGISNFCRRNDVADADGSGPPLSTGLRIWCDELGEHSVQEARLCTIFSMRSLLLGV